MHNDLANTKTWPVSLPWQRGVFSDNEPPRELEERIRRLSIITLRM